MLLSGAGGGEAVAARRWKFWGWGLEGSGLSADEERRLEEHIQTRFPGPFTVVLTYHDALGPSPSGKYEDFRCEIPD